MPIPAPQFRIQVFSDNATRRVLIESETGVLSISASELSILFNEDTDILRIMCIVSNKFGSDNMTTDIRVCGMSLLLSCNTFQNLLLSIHTVRCIHVSEW